MIEYRPAEPGDAEAVASLHARSWRENYRGSFSDEFLDGDLLGERLGVWRERLSHPVDHQFVELAVEGPNPVGFVCVYGDLDPQWGSLIENLHVAADAKHKGVGSSLMWHVGDWLSSWKPNLGIYLWVLEVNTSARRFYEHLGAKNAGVTTMETNGRAVVRSCRYTWQGAAGLSA
jgi:GNAT superfamily N-acetyltransferase